jgi:hypothetical protein
MPDGNGRGEPQVQWREVFGLLFAVLCGILLGLAAAPALLPKLGFAGPDVAAIPQINRHTRQANHISKVTHAIGSSARRLHAASVESAASRLLAVRRLAVDTASPAAFLTFQTVSLGGLALLALIGMIWLRRDMFTALLCRWARDPRQWRSSAAPALTNARCVLHLEGNTYQLGAEFFTQAVEVRFSPLFVRINARGSDRAIILPRRMPRLTPARSSTRRVAAG